MSGPRHPVVPRGCGCPGGREEAPVTLAPSTHDPTGSDVSLAERELRVDPDTASAHTPAASAGKAHKAPTLTKEKNIMTTTTVEASRVRGAVYAAFLQGYGGPAPSQDWAVDLGRPTRYTKQGTVYRQQFERGVTLANTGDTPTRVDLGGSYRDLEGIVRAVVTLPPHAADILALELQRPGGISDRNIPPSRSEARHDPDVTAAMVRLVFTKP